MTVFAVGMALARNNEAAAAMVEGGHEVASHGWRWIDYQYVPEETERAHMHLAVEAIENATGARPAGWYTGRTSPNSVRLVAEDGRFAYCADSYADDLPYWVEAGGKKPLLMVPYTLDANDMRFATAQGFNSGEQFFAYLRDSFDTLYAEGADAPKMMSVGLHCRLAGRPGRIAGLARFLDHVQSHDKVWICRRDAIARHWRRHHPHKAKA
jgi:peptidoglycan/xylan/chitin deacetylase (PgdA/CDA1 family)